MKKNSLMTGAFTLSLFLAGCTSDGIEEALETTQAIEVQEQEMISELNAISEEESTLQATFSADLDENDILDHFADGSAAVFENIENRSRSLSAISETNEQLRDYQTELETNEGSAVAQEEEILALIESSNTLSSAIDTYIEHYETVLQDQKDYFQSLGADDANYETLSEGITVLNEQYSQTTELLQTLDTHLVDLQKVRELADETLNTLNGSNE